MSEKKLLIIDRFDASWEDVVRVFDSSENVAGVENLSLERIVNAIMF